MDTTLENYEHLKKLYLEMIVESTTDSGGLPPHITIFGLHKDKERTQAIMYVPILDSFMTEEGKDVFINQMVPELSKKVKEKLTVFAVAWASEAWLREQDAKLPAMKNYLDLPIKKEVIIVHIESIFKKECNIYELIRSGHKIDENGNMVDNVTLTILPNSESFTKSGGRFADLLKSFLETETL